MGPIKGVPGFILLFSRHRVVNEFDCIRTLTRNYGTDTYCCCNRSRPSRTYLTTCATRDIPNDPYLVNQTRSLSDTNNRKYSTRGGLSIPKIFKKTTSAQEPLITKMKDKFAPIEPVPVTVTRGYSFFGQIRKKHDLTEQR